SLPLYPHRPPVPSDTSPLSLHDALPIYPGTHRTELPPQALQVHVDGARTDVGLCLPYRLEQLGPALHAAFPLEQRAQQLELGGRSEEHTSELQSLRHLVCRLLLEKKKLI